MRIPYIESNNILSNYVYPLISTELIKIENHYEWYNMD